jgi:hypothetical protein
MRSLKGVVSLARLRSVDFCDSAGIEHFAVDFGVLVVKAGGQDLQDRPDQAAIFRVSAAH